MSLPMHEWVTRELSVFIAGLRRQLVYVESGGARGYKGASVVECVGIVSPFG